MKGKLFQITGLPRCGSAFLSVLFSLEADCLGLHEQAAEDPDWWNTVEQARERFAYVADCTTYGYFPKATRPDARKVYVVKDPESSRLECVERFKFEIAPNALDGARELADQWAHDQGAHVVAYEELFRVETLREIWDFCFCGERSFPEEKVARLITMNVQRHEPERVFSQENGARLAKEIL
jgi:hypothetical protein